MKFGIPAITVVFQLCFTKAQDYTINFPDYPFTPVPSGSFPRSVAYDGAGFVYLARSTINGMDNQTYDGVLNRPFISKHALNGSRLWSSCISGIGVVNDYGYKVVVNPVTSDVFLAGHVYSNLVVNKTNKGLSDALVVKYDRNGTKLFTFLGGTRLNDYASDIIVSSQNQQVIVAGQYNNNAGIMVHDLRNGSSLKHFELTSAGDATGIVSVGSGSDCFVTGWTQISMDNQTTYGSADIFLTKLNYSNGTRYWLKIWGNSSSDMGNDVQFDPNSRLVFVGGVSGGGGINGQIAGGDSDAVLICTAENGTLLWTIQFGSISYETAYFLAIHAPTSTVFLTGEFGSRSLALFSQNGTTLQLHVDFGYNYNREIVFSPSFDFAYMADASGRFVWLNVSWPTTSLQASATTSYLSLLQTLTSTPLSSISTSLAELISSTPSSTAVMAFTDQPQSSPTPTASRNFATNAAFTTISPVKADTTFLIAWTELYAVLGAIGLVIVLVIIGIGCCIVFRTKHEAPKRARETSIFSSKTTSDLNTSSLSFSKSQTDSNSTTLMRTNFELSLPGYLMFDHATSFRMTKQIAKGGGGVVSIADALAPELSAYGNRIIVKTVGPASGALLESLTERLQKSFKQEISIMHYFREEKYIAKLLGWCSAPACILMKYYPCGSLENWIYAKDRHKSKLLLLQFMKDVSYGLQAMHTAGFVHSDLKPQNLVDTDEQGNLFCCLTDFGIVQIVDETSLLVKDFAVSKVRGLSTPYASPESFQRLNLKSTTQSANLVTKVDIYSLAVVMYELLERQKPWFTKYRTN